MGAHISQQIYVTLPRLKTWGAISLCASTCMCPPVYVYHNKLPRNVLVSCVWWEQKKYPVARNFSHDHLYTSP